jgi:hypothetical protein
MWKDPSIFEEIQIALFVSKHETPIRFWLFVASTVIMVISFICDLVFGGPNGLSPIFQLVGSWLK